MKKFQNKIALINHGCAKNLVDSELMLGMLADAGYKITLNNEEADIVIFTGGEDVDPSLYHEEKHPTTYSNLNRDLYERDKFEHIKPNQLAIGICRGLN